ncbi:MAG: flagellar biosynthesis protein FliQ [Chloroflexota bacterium]|jgi:flagellar biosynthetic protein FliQ
MTESYVLTFFQNAITIAVILVGPALLTSLIVGSLISLFQSATQIQEATLTFVPKIVIVGLVIAILGGWMLEKLIAYTTQVFESLPMLVR